MTVTTPAVARSASKSRRFAVRLSALLLGTFGGFLICEIALRWFPPIQMRIRGGRIVLPINQRTVISNPRLSKVDREIVQTRNALGFRGPDPPADLSRRLSIVAVGGSTTECYYLSDDKTWPERLRQKLQPQFPDLWLNNAGLDGHTTFGHLRLFDQYLATLRPKYLLLLVGANDVGLEQPREVDEQLRRDYGKSGWLASIHQWTLENSAICALVDNLRRTARARSAGVIHQNIQHHQLEWQASATAEVSAAMIEQRLEQHRREFLPGYHERLTRLVSRCLETGTTPVLITQPALFGPATDPTTGIDWGQVPIADWNGRAQWQLLELYNDVTRRIADEYQLPLIDLGVAMPKDSRYYYDFYHFTNEGAEEVARILAAQLAPVLQSHQP